MAIDYTFRIQWQSDTNSFSYNPSGLDTDMVYPFYATYGIHPSPGRPNVAAPGEVVFYLDNTDSDFSRTDTRTTQVEFATDGIGATFGIEALFSTDVLDSLTFCIGRVTEWNAVPGLADERTVEVVCKDYMYELQEHISANLTPQTNAPVGDMLQSITFTGADTEAMPFRPPFGISEYSTNGESLSYAYSDVRAGSNRVITPLSKVVRSGLGYYYLQPINFVTAQFWYRTLDEWIDGARTDHHTFDNQYLDIDIGKGRDYQYTNTEVTYYPVDVSDSNEILFTLNRIGHVKPGETTYFTANYTDPESKGQSITCIDTDVITPVSGTDYLVSYTSGDTDNAASSDLTINLTNKGSAAELEFINSNTSQDLYLSLLQVRGKPIRLYDNVTISKGDGLTSARSLKVDMKYQDDPDFAESALNYFDRIYNRYPSDPIVKSITFQAGADSDIFQKAVDARIGNSIRIIEDVNKLDAYYRIMNVTWEFNSFQDIVVTWGLWPTEYTSLHMVDEAATPQHMTDSNGARFAFWR